jgi:beta-galactosidase
VDETDAQPPEVRNPIRLVDPDGAGVDVVTASHTVFDLVIPQGAETVGTYGADFYAGTAAVTRHRFGRGEAWYLGTCLDPEGLDWVVRRVLARHGLVGPYADVAGLEHAIREVDGRRYDFLLHHGEKAVEVEVHADGTDLITGSRLTRGQALTLEPTDVVVLEVG